MKKLASITIRLPEESKKYLIDRAEKYGENVSEYIRILILPRRFRR